MNVPGFTKRTIGNNWWLGYGVVVAMGMVILVQARRQPWVPWMGPSLALIALLLVGWLLNARATLTITLFLAAIGDLITVSWFPFVKNLSSRESIAYVTDALTVSPADIILGGGALIVALRSYATHRRIIPPHPLRWPVLAMTAFVCYGYFRGIVMRNGDLRIAVFEGRAMFYIALVFVIAVNVYTEKRHYRAGLAAIVAGVVVQSLLSIDYLHSLEPIQREALERLNEHGSALGQNLVILALLGVLLFGVRRPIVTAALLLATAPTAYVLFMGQRRAGLATLMVALIVMAIALFWRRRRTFWATVPLAALLAVGYTAALWNSSSPAALPARAVKSAFFPGSASARDQASDLYRLVENNNLVFTIRAERLFGVGFGNPFYQPFALPDISFFEFHSFLPHNSILWIWIKFGFAGFVALFYLLAKAILLGAARVRSEQDPTDLVVVYCATAFIIMFAVFSYLDISWEARNIIFLGFAFACVGAANTPGSGAHEGGAHTEDATVRATPPPLVFAARPEASRRANSVR